MVELIWDNKQEMLAEINSDIFYQTDKELIPCIEESKNFDNTENLYIEGDNLDALKLLKKDYENKIKMIYIDPPYNTEKKFMYNDTFRNKKKKECRHSGWLNMMYPRLRLARNLLTEDGVIFISIDDNEVDNLKKLCNEVFGEANFIGSFIVNSAPNARDYGHIGKMHEFVLFYAKNSNLANTNLLPEENKKFKYTDSKGGFNIHPLYNSNEAFTNKNRPNLFYPFYLYLDEEIDDEFYKIGLEKKQNAVEIYPPKSVKNEVQFVWRWGKSKAKENINQEIIGYKTVDGDFRIVQKMRHDEKLIRSLLTETKYSSRRGTAEVEEIMESKCFSFPKPFALVYDFIRVALDTNDIILDFFSGSATTAHAVMQLNAEDGGNRKFICVQLPEPTDENSEAYKAGYKNICEIGKERIRRAAKKIHKDKPNAVFDDGFKVFKLI